MICYRSRFGITFKANTSREEVLAGLSQGQPTTDYANQLVSDALAWVRRLPDAPKHDDRLFAWECARDVVGFVLGIEDDELFHSTPKLLRSSWEDGETVHSTLVNWIDQNPDWQDAMGRYCAARKREALTAVADQHQAMDQRDAMKRTAGRAM